VSVAGSDSEGGLWWVFRCGPLTPDGDNSSSSSISGGGSSSVLSSHTQHKFLHQGVSRSSSPMAPHPDPSPEPGPDPSPSPEPGPDPSPDPGPGPDPGPDPDPDHGPGFATCGPAVQGPLLVVVLERVQSGLLGAALSALGITGLYFSVVFGRCLLRCSKVHCVAQLHWLQWARLAN
jgi:hypothetical protein